MLIHMRVLKKLIFMFVMCCADDIWAQQQGSVLSNQLSAKHMQVIVALVDNKTQGIAPVPKLIGN